MNLVDTSAGSPLIVAGAQALAPAPVLILAHNNSQGSTRAPAHSDPQDSCPASPQDRPITLRTATPAQAQGRPPLLPGMKKHSPVEIVTVNVTSVGPLKAS